MKPIVYFAAAIRGDRAVHETIIALIVYIRDELKHAVLTEHLVNEAPEKLPAQAIETRDIRWLDTATHVIAEISGGSTGVGREIEYARMKGEVGKTPAHVLCIYSKDREFYASPMIRGMDPDRYPNVMVRAYDSIEDAKEIINTFLK